MNGGVFPRWRRDGKELYFMNLVSLGAMMQSDIRVTGSSVQRDVPRLLFQSLHVIGTHTAGQYHAYSVSADGKRFLIPQFENLQTIVNVGRGGVANKRGRRDCLAGSSPTATQRPSLRWVLAPSPSLTDLGAAGN